MIKLPEAKETKFVYHGGNGAFECGYESGWNAAIAEVQRLNATAQPDGNDGYVKAFYEIASILAIPAQPNSPKHVFETVMKPKLQDLVATAQPVSDKPSLKAMMRALDTFYAHDDVPETAMLKAFRVLLADVMPAAPGGQDE
ncbi:hypothetical protein [Pantoea ananatis]